MVAKAMGKTQQELKIYDPCKSFLAIFNFMHVYLLYLSIYYILGSLSTEHILSETPIMRILLQQIIYILRIYLLYGIYMIQYIVFSV